jgi:hypothetical protein
MNIASKMYHYVSNCFLKFKNAPVLKNRTRLVGRVNGSFVLMIVFR